MKTNAPPTKKRKITKNKRANEDNKYKCNICKNDISSEVRIKCQECNDYDMCVFCFYEGSESETHKNNHRYSVINDLSTPLFSKSWGGEEELLLLEGIEMFGLGNWAPIAEHVGSKDQFQCEFHYWNTYIDNPFPTPQNSLISEPKIDASSVKKDDFGIFLSTRARRGEKPFLISQKNKFVSVKRNRDGEIIGSEVGYLPLRQGFISEHCEGAEKVIEDMSVDLTDPPDVKKMKQKMLQLYNYRISERERRKNFVIQRGLYDFKKFKADHKKRTKPEKEAFHKYKQFQRFVPKEQFDQFMNTMYGIIRLKKQINALKNYREMGICTELQAARFEREKKRRDPQYKPIADVLTPGLLQQQFSLTDPAGGGTELLSQEERVFLTTTQPTISTKQYLLIKDAMVKENFRMGYLTKSSLKKLFKHEQSILVKIYEFLLRVGWIKAERKKHSIPSDVAMQLRSLHPYAGHFGGQMQQGGRQRRGSQQHARQRQMMTQGVNLNYITPQQLQELQKQQKHQQMLMVQQGKHRQRHPQQRRAPHNIQRPQQQRQRPHQQRQQRPIQTVAATRQRRKRKMRVSEHIEDLKSLDISKRASADVKAILTPSSMIGGVDLSNVPPNPNIQNLDTRSIERSIQQTKNVKPPSMRRMQRPVVVPSKPPQNQLHQRQLQQHQQRVRMMQAQQRRVQVHGLPIQQVAMQQQQQQQHRQRRRMTPMEQMNMVKRRAAGGNQPMRAIQMMQAPTQASNIQGNMPQRTNMNTPNTQMTGGQRRTRRSGGKGTGQKRKRK